MVIILRIACKELHRKLPRRKWKLKACRGNAHLKSGDKIAHITSDFLLTRPHTPTNTINQLPRHDQLAWKGLSNARWQRKSGKCHDETLKIYNSHRTHTHPYTHLLFFFTPHLHYVWCYSDFLLWWITWTSLSDSCVSLVWTEAWSEPTGTLALTELKATRL